jgi:hypothetical protein
MIDNAHISRIMMEKLEGIIKGNVMLRFIGKSILMQNYF